MATLLSKDRSKPYIIAGPCSAESYDQVMELGSDLADRGVRFFRAGVWKPRTRPGTFDGAGEEGLKWLRILKSETGIRVSTEVASPRHLELALKYDIDAVWIGARTTASPFSVQELANAMEGVNIPVFVKNPVNPDLSLWIGAVERLKRSGVDQIGLIHRGFSFFNSGKYRNSPLWQIPIDMRATFPELLMICDISHICGVRALLGDVAQAAMDLAFDGLMVETHPEPHNALSDRDQQITVQAYDELIASLVVRDKPMSSITERNEINALRLRIDELDKDLGILLGKRMDLVQRIGEIKEAHNIPVLQRQRWVEVLEMARANGLKEGLSIDFIEELFKAIHQESIHHQLQVMNSKVEKAGDDTK